MHTSEIWIWLPQNKYPDNQTTIYSGFGNHGLGNYTVAEFKKTFSYEKEIKSVRIRFSADTLFQLYLNKKIIATGPPAAAGDYSLTKDKPCPVFYSYETELNQSGNTIDFFSRVKMMPFHLCENSKGHGGFMLSGTVIFKDGSEEHFSTDSTWLVRKNSSYVQSDTYDGRIIPDNYVFAEETANIWNTQTAPIPIRSEKEIYPLTNRIITLAPHEEKEVFLEFDRIYSGFLHIKSITSGTLFADAHIKELDENGVCEHLIFTENDEYRSFILRSAGCILLNLKNDSDLPSSVETSFIFTHYPIGHEYSIITDDTDLNLVLDTCRHTLKMCRQTMHLDSPKHCEPLACTGDYYIETLMTVFPFGDMRLAELDIIRTADLLKNSGGRLFHTSYSLIWVKWLYDVYMFTGNLKLLDTCTESLDMLLKRFENYLGENGLIETPPDYMFIDWIYIDNISMHHPPKALGQTCLNIFYYIALDSAEKIYRILGNNSRADIVGEKKGRLKTAVNTLLYDKSKELYFEGLNTYTPKEMISQFMPENTDKRYYLKHANILAAYSGICSKNTAQTLIRKIMSDECPGIYQPYFAHFLLEAVYKNGLRNEYTLNILNKWKMPVKECSKGLVEGFYPPEPTYSFDHSHAWGGTPLWSLPQALTGLEINQPGFKEITLNPSLIGLNSADIELPTPYGTIGIKLKKGEKNILTYPDKIKVHIAES